MTARNHPKTMADSWSEFSKAIFGDFKPSDIQRSETRRAFYAGMISMQAIMNNLPENEGEAMAVLNQLHREAFEYTAEVMAEMIARKMAGGR